MPRKKTTTTETRKIVKLPSAEDHGAPVLSKKDAAEAIERAKAYDAAKAARKARLAAKKAKNASVETANETETEELVVFAFRLTRAERDAIHHAAGSGKASQFVRGLAVAAATADEKTLKTIVDGLKTT